MMRCPFKLPLAVKHDDRGWSMLMDADEVSVTSFAGPGHADQAVFAADAINAHQRGAEAPSEPAVRA